MSASKLSKALREKAETLSEEHPDAAELINVLARIVEGKTIDKVFGAPGDWGYGTPIGDGVFDRLKGSPAQRGDAPAFVREERYFVIKRKDAHRFLSTAEVVALEHLVETVARCRRLVARGNLECVVVEKDWPEYEPTWKAIEQRMGGAT